MEKRTVMEVALNVDSAEDGTDTDANLIVNLVDIVIQTNVSTAVGKLMQLPTVFPLHSLVKLLKVRVLNHLLSLQLKNRKLL